MTKKKIRIWYKVLIILMFIVLTFHTYSIADVGSFDRYDSGGSDWDFGSSSSYDYDYDSNYSSDGTIILLIIWLFSTGTGRMTLLVCIIFVVLKFVLRGAIGKTNLGRRIYNSDELQSRQQPSVTVDFSKTEADILNLKVLDPLFSEEKMLAWSKNLFVKLQNAWTARDWEPMRPFESEELFEQHKSQVQGYIDTNRINVMDRIAVNFAAIHRFKQENGKDVLDIILKSTMKDYIIDEKTKKVLEGNTYQDRITVYKLTFERKTGVLTKEGDIKPETTNCPNCGAPTQITSSGRCEYCGSVITTRDYGWVLANLEPLR